ILFAPIEGMPAAREFGNIGVSLPGGLPYRSWAAEAVKANRADDRVMDPLTACLPIGIVRSHTAPMYRQIVQVSGRIVILNEYNATFRQIFTDDRPLPANPNPSWNGYSSGKWDGDALVVRTNGFRDDLWLDAYGSPLSSTGTIIEKIRRVNMGELQIELAVDDPSAYTKAWTVTL